MENFTRSIEQCIHCECYAENISGEVKKDMYRCGNDCSYGLFISKELLPCPFFSGTTFRHLLSGPLTPVSLNLN